MFRALIFAAPILVPAAAIAQSSGTPNSPAASAQVLRKDLASAAQSAISALVQAAKDKLLIADVLGAEVAGPGGQPVGTVENLAVLAGGRIVAAILSTKDGSRIAVPYTMIKVSQAQQGLNVSLPAGLPELTNSPEITKLTQQLLSPPSAN